MPSIIERVTVFCFATSYAVALGLELWHLLAPRPILRYVSISFGAAGVLAQLFYILAQPLPLARPEGSLLFLAWILALFNFFGSIHHRRLSWGLFVLPLVLGLVVLSVVVSAGSPRGERSFWDGFSGERFWGQVHGYLVLLAAVGVCVGFVASVMYLVQVHRLKAKLPPGQGMKMLSLERIEAMNRRAILWAFPLLTAGLIVGLALQLQKGIFLQGFDSTKILGAMGLWVVFAILLYLRYGVHARGKQVAVFTCLAFALLLFALVSPEHPFAGGGGSP